MREVVAQWTEATPVVEEIWRLDDAMRRALADDVRSLAAIQALRPTSSPFLWDLLGSKDGLDWDVLGSFYSWDGELPPAKSGDRVVMRFIGGDVRLADSRGVTNVVASVADLGAGSFFPPESLLFHLHSVAQDRSEALAQVVRLTSQVSHITSIDVADTPHRPYEETFAPRVLHQHLTAAEACRNSCQSVKAVATQRCLDDYGLCLAEATSIFGVCTLGCALVGEACFPVCVAAYGVQVTFCIAKSVTCYSRADDDYNACTNNCPAVIEPIVISCAPGCGSPVVINLDGRQGFRFTDASGGVSFDINADGSPVSTAWTVPGHQQAFLVWDRNGNGVIDDGRELFGDVTPQPPSADPNGFRALAMFDKVAAGGNEDGVIGPSDAVFSLLRLWIDENHDGVSQPEELSPLGDEGIEFLDLDHVVSNRRDRHGNLLRYKALVQMTDRMVESVDVFFVQGKEVD